jgi:putative endonuclease
MVDGFTKKYNVDRLVHYETYSDVSDAIGREKEIKGWSRAKKNALINENNPKWEDLFNEVI